MLYQEQIEQSKRERDNLLIQYDLFKIELFKKIKSGIPINEEFALKDQLELIKYNYFNSLPVLNISKCPFCKHILSLKIDIFDLNGFWWQEEEWSVPIKQPDVCEHFKLLSGAVNLNEQKIIGRERKSIIGPELPFAIPRILEFKNMKLVVSCFDMFCGYSIFPLVYYSDSDSAPGSLSKTWRYSIYWYKDKNGNLVWRDSKDTYTFDLKPYITRQQILWIEKFDKDLNLRNYPESDYPYKINNDLDYENVIVNEKIMRIPINIDKPKTYDNIEKNTIEDDFEIIV